MGEQVLVPDLVRAHGAQLLPGHTLRQFDAHAFLEGFAPRHRHALGRAVAQVVARVEEIHLALHDLGLRGLHARHNGGEVLLDVTGIKLDPFLLASWALSASEDMQEEE